jgi:DNA-binding CsgD family transcriptional regulator
MDTFGLLGREAELGSVDFFIEQAEEEWSALILEGEAGIGKTTLWREAIRRSTARGFAVLSCRPAEAEVKLSFAALSDLLDPVSDEVFERLPDPQCHALRAALLRADEEDAFTEPRAVAAGLRGVIVDLADSAPVLVAIDDAQWLDAPSARALQFALRRIGYARVGLLATRRPAALAARNRLEVPAAQLIELDRLSLAAIHELLKRRLGRSLPRPLLVRLYEACRGNPFFALEIARELVHSPVGLSDPLPVPKDLRRLLRRRLGRLSPATREMLLVAAAVGEPTRALLTTVVDMDPSAALEEAERAEVIEIERMAIRFSHPLYAAAIYSAAPREQRRQVHGRLGKVVADSEQRARHLALATDAPSKELAAALDEAAELAFRRGAPEVAAELTELALERTPATDDEMRQDRALDLVDRLLLVANSERAREVVRAQLPTLSGSRRRVRALVALSELAMWDSAPDWTAQDDHPVALAERALEAAGDEPSLAALAHAVLAGVLESDSEAALRHARRALELIDGGAEVTAAVHAQALSIFARCKLFLGDGLDVASLEQAIELERAAPPPLIHDRSSFRLAQWLKYVDEFERSRHGLELARRTADNEGDALSIVNILINLVILECWAGRWADARALGVELAQRFVELGWDESPTPHLALVAALTDDRSTVRELEEIPPWDGVYEVIRLRPLGLLALAEGDVAAAARHYTRALRLLDDCGIREPAVFRVHADAVESLVRSGQLDEAARVTDAFSTHARRSSIPWNRATAARSRALLAAAHGELAPAFDAATTALREHERLPMPFELARTLLVKGEIERRARQKSAAKASLERAHGIFDQLGAPLWSERARDELGRIGLRRAAGDQLTASERRVAELAASGLTNREVAAQLFLSPKTVEANLARVYRKLGIHSRAELGARFTGAEPKPTQT